MKFEEFIKITKNLPVIDTEILLAGIEETSPLRVQISRWRKAGKLIQAKRGVYLLAEHYRKVTVYEPYLASVIKKPSYISLEKALEYHSLIPESVTVFTSLTTARSGRFTSSAGTFEYRHIRESLFWGYNSVTVGGQTGFIASPEKALLDFFYFRRTGVTMEYIEELRLQNVKNIGLDKLFKYAERFKKPGILRFAELLKKYIDSYDKEENAL